MTKKQPLLLSTFGSAITPGPAQLGSTLAQARFLEIWNSGDLEIQKFGIQTIKKIKKLKIQIRSAQNVGKVWISKKQITKIYNLNVQNVGKVWISKKKTKRMPIWGHLRPFSHGPKKSQKCIIFAYFPW